MAGGGRGHTVVAGVAAPGGAGAAVAGAGGGGWVPTAGGTKALRGSWGEGEVSMGRPWCAWPRLGERERRWRGLDRRTCGGGGGNEKPCGASGGRGR